MNPITDNVPPASGQDPQRGQTERLCDNEKVKRQAATLRKYIVEKDPASLRNEYQRELYVAGCVLHSMLCMERQEQLIEAQRNLIAEVLAESKTVTKLTKLVVGLTVGVFVLTGAVVVLTWLLLRSGK